MRVAAAAVAADGPGGLPGGVDAVAGGWRSVRSAAADPEPGSPAVELLHQLLQVGGRAHHQIRNQGGFIGVVRRHHQRLGSLTNRQFRHRQHPPAGAEAAIQSQFAGTPEALEAWAVQLATGHQQGQGDGQVEGGTFLAQIRRRQVDHHPHQRAAKAAVAQGRAHPFPRLLNRLVRQTHQLDSRQAWGQVDLHRDGPCLQALQRRAATTCQHPINEVCKRFMPRLSHTT